MYFLAPIASANLSQGLWSHFHDPLFCPCHPSYHSCCWRLQCHVWCKRYSSWYGNCSVKCFAACSVISAAANGPKRNVYSWAFLLLMTAICMVELLLFEWARTSLKVDPKAKNIRVSVNISGDSLFLSHSICCGAVVLFVLTGKTPRASPVRFEPEFSSLDILRVWSVEAHLGLHWKGSLRSLNVWIASPQQSLQTSAKTRTVVSMRNVTVTVGELGFSSVPSSLQTLCQMFECCRL